MLTSANPPRKVFNTIQILRGVAALIVVLFHLTLGYERRGQTLIAEGIFQHGFAGVDLFFVISGFVIMHTSHRYFSMPAYWGTFVRKRLIRIYPVYWVTLILIIIGVVFIELVAHKPATFLPTTWLMMLGSVLLLPNHIEINGVTWSLSFELYYYFLFGLLIISRQLWPVVVLVLILSGMALLSPAIFDGKYPLLSFLLSPYNLEFASGVLAWWIIDRYKLSSFVCFLLLGIACIWLLINNGTLFEEVAKRVILYGTSSFLIVLAFTGLERNGWFKPSSVNQLLMKIGDASYLIYIIHFPLLPFYGKLLAPRLPNVLMHNIAALLFTAILTMVGIYLHINVEAPLVKKLNLLFKPINPKPNNG